MSEVDIFAQLDAELAKASAKTALKKKSDSARKIAMNRAVDEVKRLAALREWREAQAILDLDIWQPVALVALFSEQSCDGCGSSHRLFLQYMERQVARVKRPHIRDQRYIRIESPIGGLPKEVLVKAHTTHVCADCAGEYGFALAEAIRYSGEIVGISPTYEQGDINAQTEEDRSAA